jgi:hypothetical protein
MTATAKYAAAFLLLLVALGTVSTGAQTRKMRPIYVNV